MSGEPEFTFNIGDELTIEQMQPLYRRVLGPQGSKPTVSCGAVLRGAAVTWLRRQHDRYSQSIGNRSMLIRNMDITTRLELVGLSGEEP